MEVKPNKALTIAMLFSATALAGVLAIFHYGERSERGVYNSALEFKKASAPTLSSAIVFKEENTLEQNERQSLRDERPSRHIAVSESEIEEELDVATYGARLDQLNATDLADLEKDRKEILADYRERQEPAPFHLEFAPELNIALSVLLGIAPSSLTQQDLDKLQYESEQWYFVKAFAASEDFKVLLKQGRLTKDSMGPEKLKRLYGSAHHFANTN